jgi:hypothetical protein
MKLNITHNGQSHSVDIPVSWEDPILTYRKFLALSQAKDDTVKIVSVLTGLDESLIRNAKIEGGVTALMALLGFMETEITYTMPKTILGYAMPSNLEFETQGQYEDLRSVMKQFTDNKSDNLNQWPLIVATFAREFVNGKQLEYDFKRAEELAPKFWDAPALEVLAVGNFTVAKLSALKTNTMPIFRLAKDTHLSRFRQAIRVLQKNLVFSIRYALWKRKLPSPVKNYLAGR